MYTSCDVVMVCFAIDSPASLQNVQENVSCSDGIFSPSHPNLNSQQWIEEAMHYCAGIPILLIECKMDLRSDPESINKLEKIGRMNVTPGEVCFYDRRSFPTIPQRLFRACRYLKRLE